MAIVKSVGNGVKSSKLDAKVVQAALNLVQSSEFRLGKKLVVDGVAKYSDRN